MESIGHEHCSVGFQAEFCAKVVADVRREEEFEAFFAEIGVCELETLRVQRVDYGVSENVAYALQVAYQKAASGSLEGEV
jgi:hypothetical protein